MEKVEHILVISQYFYPEEFRINDICKEWVKKGKKVTVITGIPNYPQGKYYKGYSVFSKRRENYCSIDVIRLPIFPRMKNAIMMILNYLSFVCSGFFWSKFTKINADKVFIFEVSPMTQALVGVWYAQRRKIPCYLYVQDLWPENVETVTGVHNKLVIGMIDKMVNYIYNNCTRILATSQSFVHHIEQRQVVWNGSESKVRFWPQYAEDFYKPKQKKTIYDLPEREEFKIFFTGNLGYAQGLDALPKIAKCIKENNLKVGFYIIGDGRYREEFVSDIKKNDVENMFIFLGRKKPEEIADYLAHADMVYLSFSDNLLFEMTIPAKLQSYMACGKPILALAAGETKRIIDETGCGICEEPKNWIELCCRLREMMTSENIDLKVMGRQAEEYSYTHFEKKYLMDVLEKYME